MVDLIETVSCMNEHPLSNNSINSSVVQRPLLPKITLPKFIGDHQSWNPFTDLFTSLLI